MKLIRNIRTTNIRELDADDIRRAFGLAPDTEVTFRVPGGGDWSNTEIEVSDSSPIVCTCFRETTEETDGRNGS